MMDDWVYFYKFVDITEFTTIEGILLLQKLVFPTAILNKQ